MCSTLFFQKAEFIVADRSKVTQHVEKGQNDEGNKGSYEKGNEIVANLKII
jgi:hypothetical protein